MSLWQVQRAWQRQETDTAPVRLCGYAFPHSRIRGQHSSHCILQQLNGIQRHCNGAGTYKSNSFIHKATRIPVLHSHLQCTLGGLSSSEAFIYHMTGLIDRILATTPISHGPVPLLLSSELLSVVSLRCVQCLPIARC